ncbi:MAG TPA: hypothetical protein VIV60_14570, partial [Polyangiaceae bacterium]
GNEFKGGAAASSVHAFGMNSIVQLGWCGNANLTYIMIHLRVFGNIRTRHGDHLPAAHLQLHASEQTAHVSRD